MQNNSVGLDTIGDKYLKQGYLTQAVRTFSTKLKFWEKKSSPTYNKNNQLRHSPFKLNAFTLAEVLITLGIIGIVAAITIPALISSYNKLVIETRLKGFYSNINQAILMSEKDNGDKGTWDPLTSSNANIWYDKYLAPYLKTSQTTETSSTILCYFLDGSYLTIGYQSWYFYPKTQDRYSAKVGKNCFIFFFSPWETTYMYHYNKGVEPYKVGWDGTKNQLKTNPAIGCQQTVTNVQAYCTALIQINGWKIPDDYPFNF